MRGQGDAALALIAAMRESFADHCPPILVLGDSAESPDFAGKAAGAGADLLCDVSGDPAFLAASLTILLRLAQPKTEVHDRDSLSALLTERVALRQIDQWLASGKQVAILVLGIKNLAVINATYGRVTGDNLLRSVGQRMVQFFRAGRRADEIIARMEDQLYVWAAVDRAAVVEQLARANDGVALLGEAVDIDGIWVKPQISHYLQSGSPAPNATALVQKARLTMIATAQDGEVEDADAALSGHAKARAIPDAARLVKDIARLGNGDNLLIALQPQFRVASGQLTGAEALARWQHPELGLIGGETLFNVAEQAGLVRQISAAVQAKALNHAAKWPASLNFLRLSINVTASDLAAPDFASQLIDRLRISGFPPSRLTIELVESQLLADLDQAVGKLNEIRANGVRIAIDDFGTGYSSYAYLQRLPVDYLKVDSSLTSEIDGTERDRLIIHSIIDLARSLQLKVIAEGVETESQLAALQASQCEYFQGFLRAGGLDPEEFMAFALRAN
jgi:EAL domain-containing protein (putative c-di-GMP-specific phosphodiesterase class I)/GGDEF domain-containing protein